MLYPFFHSLVLSFFSNKIQFAFFTLLTLYIPAFSTKKAAVGKTSQLLLLCLFNEVDFHDFLLVILISPIIILIYIDQMASGLFYNSPDGLCSKRHILRL